MIRPRNLFLSAVVVTTTFAIYWLVIQSGTMQNIEHGESVVTQDARTNAAMPLPSDPSDEEDRDAESGFPKTQEDCLSPAQLRTHPLVIGDADRIDSASISGRTIASYRGLSAADLSDLATQGDSAAMAVLGAVSVMRARGHDEDNAVPYLLHEDLSLHTYVTSQPLEAATVKHYQEARDWYYRSALNGRLLALYRVGEIAGIIEGGAVGLGWIEKDKYESLKGFEKTTIDPATIYNALVFEIAPQLRDGPFAVVYSQGPRTEQQLAILAELAKQFDQDRVEAKLPAIDIPESTAPPMEELLSLICDSYIGSEPWIIK